MIPQQSYSGLIGRLRGLRRYERRIKLLSGALLALAMAIALTLVAFVGDALFHLSPPVRVGCLALMVGAFLSLLAWHGLRPLIKRSSLESLALRLEGRFPHLADRLVGTLQLWEKHRHNPEGYSLDLIDATVLKVDEMSHLLDFREVVDRRKLPRAGRALLMAVVASLIMVGLFGSAFRNSLNHFSHPLTEYEIPRKTWLDVTPGDVEVVKLADVTVQATARGEIPEQAELRWQPLDGDWTSVALPRVGDNSFAHTFEKLREPLKYVIAANDAQSNLYTISVIDRPKVTSLRLLYIYPHYTRMGSQVVEDDGNIRALKGTRVELTIQANKSLQSAQLVFDGKLHIDAVVEGKTATAQIQVKQDRRYHIELMDSTGHTDLQPIEYQITALEDDLPTVRVMEPGEDRDLTEDMLLPLRVAAADDFGFTAFKVRYRRIREGEEEPEQTLDIPFPSNEVEVELDYLWNMSGLGLIPEDLVSYWVEVFDNDVVSGPKMAKSQTFTVRFPSIDEILAEVEKEQDRQLLSMEEILEEERAIKERIDDLSRELLAQKDLNWEKRKEIEATLEQQQQMAQELQKISQAIEETLDKVERNELVSTEMVEKMLEIQQLVEEIATPELREAMKKLQEAMKQVDLEQLRQAMEEFKFSQEDFLQRLDRTLELLKRIQIEQKLETAAKLAQELVERQNELNASTDKAQESQLSDLSKDQMGIKEDAEALKKQVEQLAEMMEEFPEMPSQEMAEIAQTMEESELSDEMQRAANQLSACQKSGAQRSQKRISQQLSHISTMLSAAQQQMASCQNQLIVEAFKKTISDLLYLSEHQEEMMNWAERRPDREETDQLAEEQHNLVEGLVQVANNLFQMSQKTFFVTPSMGRALGASLAKMREALKHLEERNPSTATSHQQQAMALLNQAVMELRSAMNSFCSSCSSGSCSKGSMQQLLQQLNAMAQSQRGINQQTLEMGSGVTWSPEQRAAMARLAAEQDALQKGMEELAREFGNRSEILGRLDDMAKEMKNVVNDLERREISPRTLERQRLILSRLLDAQLSVHRRDYTRRRESRPGEDMARRGPGRLPPDLGERESQLRQDLMEALREGYPKEYEDLIRAYFKALAEKGGNGEQ